MSCPLCGLTHELSGPHWRAGLMGNPQACPAGVGPLERRVSEIIGPLPQSAPKGSPSKIVAHTNQLLTMTALRGRAAMGVEGIHEKEANDEGQDSNSADEQ